MDWFPYFLQQLINGLTLGSVYGLIAIGYTMVYGIIGMVNFAHGDVYMVGAFHAMIMLIICGVLGISWIPAILVLMLIVSVVLTAAYGWTVERIAYRPLRGSNRLAPLISAIGMSVLLQNYVQLLQGPRPKPVPRVIEGAFRLMGGEDGAFLVQLTYMQIVIIVVTIVLMGGFAFAIGATSLGAAAAGLRAGHEDGLAVGRERGPHHLAHFRDGRGAGRRRRYDGHALLRQQRLLHRLRRGHQGLHRAVLGGIARCPAPCWAAS